MKKKKKKKAQMKKKKAQMKMKAKKKAQLKPWILGNNPDDNNKCQCFKGRLPNAKWIAINSYTNKSDCTKFVTSCSDFFMMMPITAKKKGRMGMMG